VAPAPQRSQNMKARACCGECGPSYTHGSRIHLAYIRKERVPRGASCKGERSAEAGGCIATTVESFDLTSWRWI